MPWPLIPRVIYTDTVTPVTISSWTKDAAGGRVPVFGSQGDPVSCSVSAASANDTAQHSRESMVVSHVVVSNSRLGYLRDHLLWEETGAILTIVSVLPAGDAGGRIWEHYCEERPLR